MKSSFFVVCALSCGVCAQAPDTDACPIYSKAGGLYLMPSHAEIARVRKDTQIILVLSSGETKPCRLDHDVYPYIEEITPGYYIARDLRNGQRVLRSNGEPFEVLMGTEEK